MLITASLLTNLFFFGFTVWLGTYLLACKSQKVTVGLTGWGLIFFAMALAIEIIWGNRPPGSPIWLKSSLLVEAPIWA